MKVTPDRELKVTRIVLHDHIFYFVYIMIMTTIYFVINRFYQFYTKSGTSSSTIYNKSLTSVVYRIDLKEPSDPFYNTTYILNLNTYRDHLSQI